MGRIGLLLALLSSTAFAQAPSEFATCVACHGAQAQGIEAMNAPQLAGQNADYLVRQLQGFKTNTRNSADDAIAATMQPMAAMLTEAQMQNLANYLSQLPPQPTTKAASGDANRGYKYYQGSCGACHGPKAEGNPMLHAPNLAILSPAYLTRQYQQFADKKRGFHADDKYGRQMQFMSSALPDEQTIADVVAFIQSQGVQE
ncbi:c-type cytochrome [Paraferrimonas sedimenticola]|uniref:Cytochrome c domain-containing protein n=1 Tax=Paraferrimonas sedimenticola TaxID=375674 RepID=A0AA37RYP7_9GAMM|nr:c-type cytochrome [Paraferrimonas sedimenticola]GLP97628.1 hypothetical protein GCM10007895_29350 [Paraferrimonas sedimenticola]